MSPHETDFFISYTQQDRAWAEWIAWSLESAGYSTVIQSWDFRPGDNFVLQLDRAIHGAHQVVLVLSESYLNQTRTQSEWQTALLFSDSTDRPRVLPVRIEPVQLRGPMRTLTYVDLVGLSENASRDRLLSAVARGRSKPSQPPSFPEIKPELPRARVGEFTLMDVFKQSGTPTVTFVEPTDFYLLKLALQHPGRGVVIEGPSGIGKTSALGRAIEALHGSVRPKVVMLTARNPDHVDRIADLRNWHRGIVAIDDFHRLSGQTQSMLSDYMKYLADTEPVDRKLVLVGIPGTGRRLIDFGFDLAGRLDVFKLGHVDDEIVDAMIRKGEAALNASIDQRGDLVKAASGSLNVAQLLCYYVCAQAGVHETQTRARVIKADVALAVNHALEQMDFKFRSVITAFAAVGDAKEHIGVQLLEELGKRQSGVMNLADLRLRRPDMADGISRFIRGAYIDQVRSRYPALEQHVLYVPDAERLAFDDPQLAFYLRSTPPERWLREAGKVRAHQRKRIFISYSHADALWLKRVRVHLTPLERDGQIDTWDDTRLSTGSRWREELRANLESAGVAVLLVSADFLASDFIATEELPPLLKAAEESGTVIMPVIVAPCRFADMPALSQFQSVNPPSRPLVSLSKGESDGVLVKLAREIDARRA